MFNIDINIKEFFLIIQKYHIYFDHFPNNIIKNKEALPLNLYDIGIKNLDENDTLLWFIDKINSQRLLKIFFIRHCIIAFFESEKNDFSLIWKIFLISLKKELEILKRSWGLNNTENKIIKHITWKDIWDKLLAEYKNSFFHNIRENNLDIKKRKIILWICFTSPNYFLDKDKIPYNNLFNYIIKQDEEKLSKIDNFLYKNKKINFLENNLLFIFQNNLEDFNFKKDDLDEDIEFIGDLIKDYKKTPQYICSLDRESFELLRDTYKMVGYIIYSNNKDALNEDWSIGNNDLSIGANLLISILQDKEDGIEKYKKYKKMKAKVNEDFKYIHPSSLYYKQIQELEGKSINENFSFDDFTQEFEKLYGDEEFKKMLTFNKKIVWENKSLEILDNFYILFQKESPEIQTTLIEEIFFLSQENILFLYQIFISSKWILDNENFDYVSLIWKIHKIIKNKDIFIWVNDPQEIFDGINLCIEDWENHQEKEENNNGNSQINKYFIEL